MATHTPDTLAWQYMLPTLQAKASSSPRLRLLDVGCGSGKMTIELAKLVPHGEVIGVDISAAILESAKLYAQAQGVQNVRVLPGDVYSLEKLGLGEFDMVCTHQVIAHCKEPTKAIKQMLRVTKKVGRVLCIREGDLTSGKFGPDWPLLQECFQVVIDVHQANGGTADAGKKLLEWLLEAGVPRRKIVDSNSESRYDTMTKRREYGGHWPGRCTHGLFADKALELGVSRSRLQEYAVSWKKWINSPDAFFIMTHGEVIVTI